MQLLTDLPIGEAVTDQHQDLALLLGEGGQSLVFLTAPTQPFEHLLGEGRVEQALAIGDLTYRVDQIVAADLLQT